MNILFDLAIIQDGILLITDTTHRVDLYLPEDNDNYVREGRFKYSDTYTINVIKYVSTKTCEVLATMINSHKDEEGDPIELDEAYFKLSKDGHYIIEHLILPNKDNIPKITKDVDYDAIYCTDGTSFYLYKNEQFEPCDIYEIMNANPESTTISKSILDTFSLYLLNNKYLKECKKAICNIANTRCITKQDTQNLTMDLLWITLNAIKYNVELGMLNLAQFLLEEVSKCSVSFQNNSINTRKNECDCCL